MSKSGTLLTFNRTRLRLACLGATQPSPVVYFGISAEGPALCGCYYAGPPHYAALILSESTYSGRKSEIQSRGFSHSDHSGEDPRSFNAGDSIARSARQTNVYRYRRSYICATQGNRELQTERSRTAKAQAVRKENEIRGDL